MRFIYLFTWTLSLTAMVGCQGSVAPLGGPGAKKADKEEKASGDILSAGADPNTLLGKDTNVINAKYNVSVTAVLKDICSGQMQFKIKTTPEKDGQLFELPYGKLHCKLGGLIPDIDIANMLSATGDAKDFTGVTVTDSVIRLSGLRQSVYAKPFRPFLPSFLAGSPDELRNLQLSEPVTVKDSRTLQTASGSVSMKMISFGMPYFSKAMPGTVFDNTLHFRVTNEGFDGYEDRLGAMLFDVMEMTISLNPVAIVNMHFETKMKDVMKAGGQSGMFTGGPLGELLMGGATVKIDIDMFDQEGLSRFMEQQKAQNGN